MMKNKRKMALLLAACMLMLTACGGNGTKTGGDVVTTPTESEQGTTTNNSNKPVSIGTQTGTGEAEDTRAIAEKYPDAHVVALRADGSVTLDGETVEEFDYTWHADPSEDHGEVKNCPAEYFTGTEPETDAAIYVAHDIYYYPELDESGFTQVRYDDETEWCYYYTAEGLEDYIFATLPVQSGKLPTQMMHSEQEAYSNPVVHITQPGEYVLEGEWNGQVWIDLGDKDDTFADENACVTVILNGVDVTCDVAPALVFYSVYECDNEWEDREEYGPVVDLADAGAKVVICDGTENNFTGTNVYRMLKAKFKDDSVNYAGQPQKKARKIDGTFYSCTSMSVGAEQGGTGVLNINAGFEGLDTELHLEINGGNINIFAQDDAINVNEDYVSVVTINGGNVHILGGLGVEGDGIDSNGYLVINGGTVIASANPASDSGLDSDGGSYIYGGTVLALGSTMDWAESDGTDSTQAVMNLSFSSYENADEEIEIKDAIGRTVFFYEPEDDAVIGGNARRYRGAVISSPNLQVHKSYAVYVGGVQQAYSSTGELGGFGFGGFGPGGFGGFGQGGERPDGSNFDPSQIEGFDPSQMGQGGQPPQMPDGSTFDPSQMGQGGQPPQMPDGSTFDPSQMGQGGQPPQMPDGSTFDPSQMGNFDPNTAFGGSTSSGELYTEFELEDTVNGFIGVTDIN